MTELKQIPIRIEGDWQKVAYVGHADWQGLVSADEPITALALARGPAGTQWSRIGRGHATELTLSLQIRPLPSDDSRYAVRMSLRLQPVGFTYGDRAGAAGFDCRLTSTAPVMFSLNHHSTGTPAWLTEARTAERMRLGALFVAEADTRGARKHLWYLRKGIDGPDVPLTAALVHGRSGHIA